jgi:molybdate transport system permease protein
LLARRAFPGRDVVDALSTVPMVLPPSVLGYYLLVALGRNSPLGQALKSALGLQLVFTWQGAVVAAGVVAFPLMVQSARAAFEGVDAGLEEVARTLGRSEWDVFRTVTLPLAWRGVFAGTVLAFARALGDFGTTLMVASNIPGRTQTLSVAIYDAVQAGDDGRAVLLVAVVTAVAVALLLTARRMGQRVVR